MVIVIQINGLIMPAFWNHLFLFSDSTFDIMITLANNGLIYFWGRGGGEQLFLSFSLRSFTKVLESNAAYPGHCLVFPTKRFSKSYLYDRKL